MEGVCAGCGPLHKDNTNKDNKKTLGLISSTFEGRLLMLYSLEWNSLSMDTSSETRSIFNNAQVFIPANRIFLLKWTKKEATFIHPLKIPSYYSQGFINHPFKHDLYFYHTWNPSKIGWYPPLLFIVWMWVGGEEDVHFVQVCCMLHWHFTHLQTLIAFVEPTNARKAMIKPL